MWSQRIFLLPLALALLSPVFGAGAEPDSPGVATAIGGKGLTCPARLVLMLSREIMRDLGANTLGRPPGHSLPANDQSAAAVIFLEDQLIEFYLAYQHIAPEYRPNEALAARLGVAPTLVDAILAAYNLDDLLTTDSEYGFRIYSDAFIRVQRRADAPLARWLETNLLRFSVTQLARQHPELFRTEHDIYAFLFRRDFSIERLWRRRPTGSHAVAIAEGLGIEPATVAQKSFLDHALALFGQGDTVARAAEKLGVGEEALGYGLHYERAVQRERRWEDWEETELRSQWGVLTGQEIALFLQRSQQSVYRKAERLGLGIETPRYQEPVEVAPFGLVRDKGEFLRPAFDHLLRSDSFLSDTDLGRLLHCSPRTIAAWRGKLGIASRFSRPTPRQRAPAEEPRRRRLRLERHELQRHYVQTLVSFFQKNPTVLQLGASVFRQVSLDPGRFYGTSTSETVFDSQEEGVLALRLALRAAGVDFLLLNQVVHNPSETFVAELRDEAQRLLVEWIETNGGVPGGSHAAFQLDRTEGHVGFTPKRFLPSSASRLFHGYAAMMGATLIWARAHHRTRAVTIIERDLVPENWARAAQEREVAQVVAYLKLHPEVRALSDTVLKAAGVDISSFYGFAEPGKKSFASQSEAMLALKAATTKEAVPFYLLNQKLPEVTPELQRLQIAEATDLLIEWIETYGKIPQIRRDFGVDRTRGKVGISENRLYAEQSSCIVPGGYPQLKRLAATAARTAGKEAIAVMLEAAGN